MARRRASDPAPSLFAISAADRAMEVVPPAAQNAQSESVAAALPPGIRLGTSSWSFPGWRGLVFATTAPVRSLASEGLAAYAHHGLHRTVGLDRAFYEVPSVQALRQLAAQVPEGFRFVVKAHQSLTRPHLQADGTTMGSTRLAHGNGAPNPRFLDASWATEAVVHPLLEGLGAACGPIVFQFPAINLGPREAVGDEVAVLERLGRFLERLPAGPIYAVEFRNDTFLKPRHVAAFAELLASVGAVPALGLLPTMPSASEAASALLAAGWHWSPQRPLVVRWLLGHGLGYEEARQRFEPFDQASAPDVSARHQVADLVVSAQAAGAASFVIINNKAEGSAPRSIEMLARVVVDRLHRSVEVPRKASMS